ncbi:MAG TPA: helix-turn-helix domain-containing protein [Terracidiphilus sp.]|jgi:transcriptional regulator with XRE-family HTH domain|nr:helix-turn-helix domain-containing protein [Terracidiphilus sp.]
MERDVQGNYRLDWPRLVETAKARRKQMKLTQRRLAAIAGVSLPTVVNFEAGEDLRLSSAHRILEVLDMAVKPIEGTLRIRTGGTFGTEPFSAMFVPYTGPGGAMEPHQLSDLSALEEFLDELGVDRDVQAVAFGELRAMGAAEIVNVILTTTELRRIWPVQFAAA